MGSEDAMNQPDEMCRVYSVNPGVDSAEIIGCGKYDGAKIITINLIEDDGTVNRVGFTPEVAVELADRIIEKYLALEMKK